MTTRVVMTGATAGLGLDAARRLLASDVSLTVGARSPDTAPAELSKATVLPLDLASLASVRDFTKALGDEPINALVLNAGLQTSAARRSDDGHDLTFAVNHLAHYLLLRRLDERLPDGARVVVTSSGAHDPAAKTTAPAPRHADVTRLADGDVGGSGGMPDLLRAYSASKLLNVVMARHLARERPGLDVLVWDPAYVPGTSLSRDVPAVAVPTMERAISLMLGPKGTSTVARSGLFLSELVLNDGFSGASGDYWSVRGERLELVEPSTLANDPALAELAWSDSQRLVADFL